MKVRYARIQNFRGIEDSEIHFKTHTLLVGGNNIGKSTVCEALDLVLGPERLYRRPVVDEHDFHLGKYLDAEGAPLEIRIDVVLTSLSEEERRRELDKIPTPERRKTWEMLMFNTTPRSDIEESKRRIEVAIKRFDALLKETPYLAGEEFSLADVDVMATFYGLPLNNAFEVDAEATPHLWHWLKRCHARPGIQAAFGLGRGFITKRAAEVREALGVETVAAETVA